ncbi:Sodium/glucose cotransporter [Pirellulimonas nuda]|uniref:Sodium/glucose cotransporter n=1 Tax=Pirellulimonas nuda TaxID=2528009 RepID=A0A518D5B6_9BACT|nr:sodium/solute symporter [Pirellulimonas nuda]QDU86661.1 Sodium/glucose cotransporter [Pirellulimonas nuda]
MPLTLAAGIEVGGLDYATFGLYFLALFAIGFGASRTRSQDAQDYFLAGRSLPWYVIGASYIAANISTEHFIGLIGAGYIYGICVATGEWSTVIAFSFLIWVFIPFLYSAHVFTAPQFMEKRFNEGMRAMFALVTVIANVVAFLAPVLYGGGLVVEEVFGLNAVLGVPLTQSGAVAAGATPWGLYLAIGIIGFTAGVWSIWGGLRSIAWMDLLTIIVMVIGGLSVTYFGLQKLGDGSVVEGARLAVERNAAHSGAWQDGVERVRAAILPGHDSYDRLSVLQPLTHETNPWTHWVLSFFYIGLWYTVINQFLIQKIFGAKDMFHARMGMTFASYLKLLLPFIVVVPGMIYFALSPATMQADPTPQFAAQLASDAAKASGDAKPTEAQLVAALEEAPGRFAQLSEKDQAAWRLRAIRPQADKTYVRMLEDLVPFGLRGFLLAALFGAIQSTVSAVLTSTSTVITVDGVQRYVAPNLTDRQMVAVGRWTTAVVLIVSILMGLYISTLKASLFVYIQELFTYFAPPFSAVFLLGTLWRRINGVGALTTAIVGLAFGLAMKVWLNTAAPAPDTWQADLHAFLGPYANQGAVNWLFCMALCAGVSLLTPPPRPEQVTDELTFNWRKMDFGGGLGAHWYSSVTLWWGMSLVLMLGFVLVFSVML